MTLIQWILSVTVCLGILAWTARCIYVRIRNSHTGKNCCGDCCKCGKSKKF